jgi:hypothetical protein
LYVTVGGGVATLLFQFTEIVVVGPMDWLEVDSALDGITLETTLPDVVLLFEDRVLTLSVLKNVVPGVEVQVVEVVCPLPGILGGPDAVVDEEENDAEVRVTPL